MCKKEQLMSEDTKLGQHAISSRPWNIPLALLAPIMSAYEHIGVGRPEQMLEKFENFHAVGQTILASSMNYWQGLKK